MLSDNQRRWGVDQWAAYLSSRELPCMGRSQTLLKALEETQGERLSARELADLAGSDPLLCLRLLREAEQHRAQRLGHETTTPLGAVMQLGTDQVRQLVLTSRETDESDVGLAECESRAYLARHLALRWGSARADISPDEVAMAALLSEIGELLLWIFARDLPAAAENGLASGRYQRSAEAQLACCGFRFKELTLKCAQLWHLPMLLTQLIRGVDNTRANLSRLCVDTARHLTHGGADNPALPSDIALANQTVPGATPLWLAEQLPGISPEQAQCIAQRAEALLHANHGTEPGAPAH